MAKGVEVRLLIGTGVGSVRPACIGKDNIILGSIFTPMLQRHLAGGATFRVAGALPFPIARTTSAHCFLRTIPSQGKKSK